MIDLQLLMTTICYMEISMSGSPKRRKILHVDIDSFFSSVEQLDNPSLRGKPVIVGGNSARGVVSTASYEARAYGVHSAMPIFQAKALCPHGIYVKGRMARYKEVSEQVFSFLAQITDEMSQVSIDEAYLDITSLFHSMEYVANYIKKNIKKRIGLSLSVGGSYNMFLAKLASEWNKPDGIFFINEEDVPNILLPLNISKIHGLGKKSQSKLNNIGIFTVQDLLGYRKEDLKRFLGSSGEDIYYRIRGIDDREVVSKTKNKSIAKESTFSEDTDDKHIIVGYVDKFCRQLEKNLLKYGYEARTIGIKYKTVEFKTYTKSKTLYIPIRTYDDIFSEAMKIVDNIVFDKPIRLIGVTLSGLTRIENHQITLFENM